MTKSFFSVDPGLKVLGWALWGEEGTLISCGLSKAPKASCGEQAIPVHRQNLWMERCAGVATRVVCERMESRGWGSVAAADILELQLIAGALGTEFVRPSVWKGSASRQVEQNRTRNKLRPEELEKLLALGKPSGLAHNAWSAVGIGLWYLKRPLTVSPRVRQSRLKGDTND